MAGQLISDASGYEATEFDTKIPSLSDQANIVEAFKLYHYGLDNYTGAEAPAADSMHAHLDDLDTRLASIENGSYVNSLTGTANQIAVSASIGGITLSLPADVTIPDDLTVTDDAFIGGDLSVTGNLFVSGSTSYVNVSNLNVEDSLLYMGASNPGNSVDLGIVASFTGASYQHAGLVRDATDNTWKLFSGVTDEPTTVINFDQAIWDTLKLGTLDAQTGVTTVNLTTTGAVDIRIPTNAQSGTSYTAALADVGKLVEMDNGSSNTLTIPLNSTTAFPVGSQFVVVQTGSGQTTIAGAVGVTINATPGLKLRAQWSSATIVKRSTDTWVAFGDLVA